MCVCVCAVFGCHGWISSVPQDPSAVAASNPGQSLHPCSVSVELIY